MEKGDVECLGRSGGEGGGVVCPVLPAVELGDEIKDGGHLDGCGRFKESVCE